MFDGATCNSTDQSGCNQVRQRFAVPYNPGLSAADPITHTLYVPMTSEEGTLGFAALVDVSACNGTVRSGCGVGSPHLVNVGSLPFQVLIDSTTRTAYILSNESSSISVLNTATCNAQNQSGCPRVAPALATGINPTINIVINPYTHTLYSQSQDSNSLWVFDTRQMQRDAYLWLHAISRQQQQSEQRPCKSQKIRSPGHCTRALRTSGQYRLGNRHDRVQPASPHRLQSDLANNSPRERAAISWGQHDHKFDLCLQPR